MYDRILIKEILDTLIEKKLAVVVSGRRGCLDKVPELFNVYRMDEIVFSLPMVKCIYIWPDRADISIS